MTRRIYIRLLVSLTAVGCIALIDACGPMTRSVPILMPHAPDSISTVLRLPRTARIDGAPLVVLLDDGPPVDVTLTHPQRYTIDQLEARLLREGYAVWRPFRNVWEVGDLTVYCPDQLTSWTLLGLKSVRAIPQIGRSRIVVLGFGQGGFIAALTTRRASDLVHAVGFVGTPARALDVVLTSPALRDSITRARLLDTFDGIWAGTYPDTTLVLNGEAQCWRSWLQVSNDMRSVVEAITQPFLAVQGTADTLLPALDIERYRNLLKGRSRSRVEVALGVQHDLRDAVPDPKQDPDDISPRVVDPVMSWLTNVAPVPQ
jgi:pimeloyl-ACP methyl ester carboxylesterase